MKLTEPLVSIITPVYNGEAFVPLTIESVLRQTYPHWELILVDDASTSPVLEVLLAYAKNDARIKVISLKENVGAAQSRNKGIEAAQGRFIAFLDADDLWLPNKLEEQVAFSLANNAVLTHTSYEWVDLAGKNLGKRITAKESLTYSNMLDYNYIGCLTAMYDVQLLGKKYYMPNIRLRQDYGLWLSILRDGHTALGLDKCLAHYRTGGKSLSSNKWKSAGFNWQILRNVEGLGIARSSWHFLRYALRGLLKYS